MRKITMLMIGALLPILIYAQQFEGYLGAGFSDGITVTSSSNLEREHWNEVAAGQNTINGNGLDFKQHTASRFLSQATLGADLSHIMEAAELGPEAWLDSQFVKEPELMLSKLNQTYEDVINWRIIQGIDTSEIPFRPYWNVFNYAWWELNMENEDLLRHRVAMALSEILVVSFNSDLSGFGRGMADYYDIFLRNSFGNYRDILKEVTLHPCMGFYLSHLNNPKAIPAENIHPDENYAREIMQLFTIGLYELNPDGTRKTDNTGDFIPTYGQEDIREFAKVFTGLSIGAIYENEWVDDPYFGIGIWVANMTVPMIMYEEWHDQDTKSLLNGIQLPAGQTGLKDIDDALNVLFEHPNVGPFIGRQLIQRLVTSNPSPGYVSRVTTVFDDNGEGVRGDMKAVIKAILLDDEARSCTASMDPFHGKMREPLIKYSHTARALEKEHYYDRYWNTAYNFLESTDQSPLFARSVFNFFLPDFQPNGDLQNEGLFGPEFQIHNSRTSIDYINEVNYWTYYGVLMNSWEENDPYVFPDYEGLKYLAREPEVLINRLDLLFTHGTMSSHTRENIKTAMKSLYSDDYRKNRAKMGLYLTLISPDYAILR